MGRRYSLTTRLEESALAELYKARAEGPGSPEVLVKLFTPKASDAAYAQALADIAARTRALGQPMAQGFDEVGFVRDRLAAVRGFIDGYTLGDALRRLMSKEVVLPPALALFIVAEAAQAVSAAHLEGWAHGAITPGNILLGVDGRVRVVDFGALEAMSASPELAAFAAKGRHAYRAPELKRPGAGGAAADVYSLGAITYELLTLREVASVRGSGLSTKRDALLPPSRLDRRLNARMDPVVMRALDQAATRRYRTAAELSDALRGLFSVLGYAPGHAELVRFVRELFPNEVSIGALGGPVAINGPFELQQVRAEVSSPAAEARQFGEDERIPFTSTDAFPALADEPPSQPARRAAAREAPRASAPAPKTVEEWEAPPGQMPESPRLHRPNRVSAPHAQPEPRSQRTRRETPLTPVRAAAARDTVEVSALETPIDNPLVEDAAFDDRDLDPSAHASTSADWHLPPAPEPEKPRRPRISPAYWVLAIAFAAACAAGVYLAYARRLGVTSADMSLIDQVERGQPTRAGAPVDPSPQRPIERPVEPRAMLTIESDVEASVFIDGIDTNETTPLVRYAIAAGPHTVLLVHGEATREFNVRLTSGEEEKRVESFAAAKSAPTVAPTKAAPVKIAPVKRTGKRRVGGR